MAMQPLRLTRPSAAAAKQTTHDSGDAEKTKKALLLVSSPLRRRVSTQSIHSSESIPTKETLMAVSEILVIDRPTLNAYIFTEMLDTLYRKQCTVADKWMSEEATERANRSYRCLFVASAIQLLHQWQASSSLLAFVCSQHLNFLCY